MPTTPTPTIPSEITFNFPEDPQGWTFIVPDVFDQSIVGDYNATEQSLDTTTADNTNTFGMWESPEIQIVNGLEPEGAAIPIAPRHNSNGDIFRSTFDISSDLSDPSEAPVVRVRSSSIDFQQSDVLVATSMGDGSFSPDDTAPKTYVQWFSQPEGQDMFRLDFDVLNTDSLDAVQSTTSLERVTIEALGQPDLQNGEIVAAIDFLNGGQQGFSPVDASPGLTAPETFNGFEGLLIRGVEPVDDVRSPFYPPVIFGFWDGAVDAPILANTLYRVHFDVTSDAPAGAEEQVPTFRLRVNDSSLKFSAYTNIDSVNANAGVPVDGAVETYDVWFQTPDAIAGNTWNFSFDYLFVDKSGDDGQIDDNPEIALILNAIEVTAYDVPGAAPTK